jgi:hypothetical protein
VVNFYKKRAGLHKRRAVSTIVGAAIFLVLFASASSTFFIAMDVQRDTINTQRIISDSIMEKSKEKFSIAVSTDESNNNKLGIQVKNQGTNPVEIGDVWIINNSGSFPAKKYLLDYKDSIIPPGYGSNILENTPLFMNTDDYDIKVVSTLGTIEKSELKVGGNNYLLAEMFAIPPDVRQGENATIALRVTNVGPTMISGVAPDNLLLDDVLPPHILVSNVEAVSISPIDLNPSESTIFSWHITLKATATVGIKVKFSNFATGTESVTGFAVTSNMASDKIIVRDPQGGSGEEIVIKDELFAKPDIFMLVPSTFGESEGHKGLWGITVANPTDATMYVSKVSVTILYAGANSNQEIFTKGCTHLALIPATDYWECTNDNNLVWYDDPTGTYKQAIPARSAYTFLVTVEPGKTTGVGDALDSVIVHTSIFTSLGAFGEAKWTSAVVKGAGDALTNVYLVEGPAPYNDPNDMRGNRMGIASGSPETFQIALADLSPNANAIKGGAELIINIPKDWGLPSLNSFAGFVNAPIINQFPDNSYQIVGTLIRDLNNDAKIISFDTVAPSVLCDKMYVMHVLANGLTIAPSQKTIGPVAEIVLQVNPAGACP